MIAQRFRPLIWASGAALAATGLYLVSVQVSAEHKRLADVNRQIDQTEHDIGMLKTELATRANLRQLEKWNSDSLALTAPRAAQYLSGPAALARFDPAALDGTVQAPLAAMAEVTDDKAMPAPAADQPSVAPANKAVSKPSHVGGARMAMANSDHATPPAFAPARASAHPTQIVMLDDALTEALHGRSKP